MKRVLITGRNGYIATSLLAFLKGFPKEYEAESVSLRGCKWEEMDFSGYDAVVHCAGFAHARESAENAHLFYRINRDLTVAVAEKAKAEGVRQFIYLSSLSVYGMDEGVITLKTELHPKTAYGRSKLEAERSLQAMETETFRVTILRPPMVYGEGCKGNYQTLVKLARMLPAVPSYTNRRSAVSITRLCEFVKARIDNEERGVFVPQDKQYLSTCAEIKRIAAERGRVILTMSILNVFPAILRRYTETGRKAFGNLEYRE